MTTAEFAAAFRDRFPDLVGRPVLVALSGGADSVALLLLLHEAAGALGCPVHAAHVHHHLRGEEADRDATHCGELCTRLGVPLVIRHLAPDRPRGSSPEAWWRRRRYEALESARAETSSVAVATAHTRDDQAETVLLKLLRGAGPRGVAGIRRRSGNLVRPLLDFERSELRAYLTGRGVTWREDATNADPTVPRAWVRTHLLPLVAGRFPGSVRHLAEFAAVLAGDERVIGGLLGNGAAWPEVGAPVALAPLAALPPPLLKRWTLELAGRLPLAEPPSRRQLDAVVAMARDGRPAAVDLGRRWVLRRRGVTLLLCPPPLSAFAAVPATVPSESALPGGFVARLGGADPAGAHRALLHVRTAGLGLEWRSVAAGERFADGPPVTRLLARAGVPAEWRRAWPALWAGDTMVWLPAVGVAKGWEGNEADGVRAGLEEPWGRHVR